MGRSSVRSVPRQGDRGKANGDPASLAAPNAKMPVERLLPPAVIAELKGIVHKTPEITAKLAEEVDSRLGIARQYSLSRRRLLNYLRRLPRDKEPAKNQEDSVDRPAPAADWPDKLLHHRKRQVSVGSILDAVFGPLGKCAPELWERRTYLMLVGLVYERLATSEVELPTKELVSLAKVLAENRRVETRVREADEKTETEDAPTADPGALPPRFGEIVRQLYGTNFQQGSDGGNDKASEETTACVREDKVSPISLGRVKV